MAQQVFRLAKELKIPTKELLDKIKKFGIEAEAFTNLSDAQIQTVKQKISEPGSAKKVEAVAPQVAVTGKVRRRISAKKSEEESDKTEKPVKQKKSVQVKKTEGTEIKVADKEVAPAPPVEEKTTAPQVEEKKPELKELVAEPEKKGEQAKQPAVKIEEKKAVKEEPKLGSKAKTERPSEKKTASDDSKEKVTPKQETVVKQVTPQKSAKESVEPKNVSSEKKGQPKKENSHKPVENKPEKQRNKVVVLESMGNGEKQDKGGQAKKGNVKPAAAGNNDRFSNKSKQNRFKKGGKPWKSGRQSYSSQPAQPKHTFNPRKKEIKIGEVITVGELASMIGIKVSEIIKTLMSLGIMATITQAIDGDTAAMVAQEFNVEIVVDHTTLETTLEDSEDSEEELSSRPPVITIMGHVDHGKTSLLDKIRSTNVSSGEAGGITQHIGAYHVNTDVGAMTFLDTPGHEAFTAMRARGANVTDIVILVVAADDGPKPQTVEAINHAQAAEVPIIVAINKCDVPGADPLKAAQKLMEYGLVSEDYGGDTIMVSVSAKTGEGVDKLLEMVALTAEVGEYKANSAKSARGVVIESRVDKGCGNLATVLIQSGTLRIGDNFVVGNEYGKVRAMNNDKGKSINKATPSTPVEIIGVNGTPEAGDKFVVAEDEKTVRQISSVRSQKAKDKAQTIQQKANLESLFNSISTGEKSVLNLIIKADVIGSVEAITESLNKLGNDEVSVRVIHRAVGAITVSDVILASASDAVIIGFNVRPEVTAKRSAMTEGVDIRLYSVIYDAIEDVRKALEGLLTPIIREEIQGKAKVLQVINVPKIGPVAGCQVMEGKILRNSGIRLLRNNVVIYDGKLSSLRRFKDDVKEVATGYECGMGMENCKDIRPDDVLESYIRVEEAARL